MIQNVMFFGDSNTWGFQGDDSTHRLSADKRFTGIVASRFPQLHFIEEGLCGRTICNEDPIDPGRNGMQALPMLLTTHDPIDLVIIMLGTNDSKRMYGHSPYTIGEGMDRMIRLIKNPDVWSVTGVKPSVMLVAPPSIGDISVSGYYGMFDEHSAEVVSQLPPIYQQLAERLDCIFVDGSVITAEACSDHVHLTAPEHAALATLIADKLSSWING